MYITSGAYKGRRIKTLSANAPDGYRPATAKVRQAIFSMLDARGLDWERSAVLDLFAGSGALGFEALSRGAAYACFVEKDKAAVRCIEDNLGTLAVPASRALVLHKDLFAALKRGPGQFPRPARHGFGLVCIDPPYGQNMLGPALAAVLDKGWAATHAFVLAEIETRSDFAAATCDYRLEPLVDREYGQTRIVLWQIKTPPARSSTPAPSIP